MEGKDAHIAKQEKVTRKRTRRRGLQERTRQRKAWTLREYGGKSLWDWMDLLIVPFMLALVTVAFTLYQDSRQTRFEQQRADRALKIEEQRAQDAALQAYLDQMSVLLLEVNLRDAEVNSPVRTLARARTATVIQRLDAEGNRNVIRFLEEAGLACSESTPGLLAGVDLRGAHLESVDLSTIDLSNAILNGAKLRKTNLREANLSNAILNGAKLSNALLAEANLSNADLRYAKLDGTILFSADLSNADLKEADLRGANLDYADLSHAEEITKEQLEKQTERLHGTTMPDGSQKQPVLPPGDPYGTVHHASQEGDC